MARKRLTEAALRRLTATPPATRQSIQEDGLRFEVNPSGKASFFAAYYDSAGRKHKDKLGSYPAISLAEARKAVLSVKHDVQIKEIAVKQSASTLNAFIEGEFAEWCKANRKQGTETLDRLRHQHANSRLGRRKLKEITPQDVDSYKSSMLRKYAPATVARNLGDLKRVLNLAVEWGHLRASPAERVAPPRIDKQKTRLLLTDEEFDRLTAQVDAWEHTALFGDSREQQYRPAYLPFLVRLLANTGMRKGEALALRWRDIDEGQRIITIRGETAKSARTRQVPISEKLMEHLKVWNTLSGREHDDDDNARVFPVDDPKRAWSTLRKLARLDHVDLHTLRHNFASQLVLRGVPISVVRDLLGHTSITTTSIYLSVRTKDKVEAVNLL